MKWWVAPFSWPRSDNKCHSTIPSNANREFNFENKTHRSFVDFYSPIDRRDAKWTHVARMTLSDTQYLLLLIYENSTQIDEINSLNLNLIEKLKRKKSASKRDDTSKQSLRALRRKKIKYSCCAKSLCRTINFVSFRSVWVCCCCRCPLPLPFTFVSRTFFFFVVWTVWIERAANTPQTA